MSKKSFVAKIETWPNLQYHEITVDEKIAEIRHELAYRESVFLRLVDEGRMTKETAARRTAIMKAVLQDYLDQQPNLFNQS
jgi:predicted DNA-binding protein (UPF0251 family)